jgi:hypothetical protein
VHASSLHSLFAEAVDETHNEGMAHSDNTPRPVAFDSAIADVLTIAEVADAAPYAGALFQRAFHAAIPDYPRHYIATYARHSEVVGYVHFTPYEDVYLCGGMVINAPAYRTMPADDRARLGAAGGIAEIMLRACFADLTDRPAIFGYCGDTKAMRVDLRAGFERTLHPLLIVHWKQAVDAPRKQALIDMVHRLGAF